MRNDPESVVSGLFAAWRIQDIEATLAYLSDDIAYKVHQPPTATWPGGPIIGKTNVRSYLETICATWQFIEMTAGAFDIRGNEVRELTRFHSRHRATGEELQGTKRHIWLVDDGRIVHCQEYQDEAAVRAFMRMVAAR